MHIIDFIDNLQQKRQLHACFRDKTNVEISGQVGCGKTVLFRMFVAAYQVHAFFADESTDEADIRRFIDTQQLEICLGEKEKEKEKDRGRGGKVVIFDDMDVAQHFEQKIRPVLRYVHDIPNAFVAVITDEGMARISAVKVHLQPMSDERMFEYVMAGVKPELKAKVDIHALRTLICKTQDVRFVQNNIHNIAILGGKEAKLQSLPFLQLARRVYDRDVGDLGFSDVFDVCYQNGHIKGLCWSLFDALCQDVPERKELNIEFVKDVRAMSFSDLHHNAMYCMLLRCWLWICARTTPQSKNYDSRLPYSPTLLLENRRHRELKAQRMQAAVTGNYDFVD
jgi:hypothetical protein